MNVDDSIVETLITWKMVEEDIQRKYDTKASTGPRRTATHLGDANGYISKCALIKFDWTEDREKLPKQGIMKITSCERFQLLTDKIGAYDNVIDQAALFNDCEVNFYETWSSLEVVPEIPVPKYICGRLFGVNGLEAGYCILEKLENFHNLHIYHNLSEKAALDGIKSIAKLTSYSIKYPKNARKLGETDAFDVHFRDFTKIEKVEKGFECVLSRFADKEHEIKKIKTILPIFKDIDTFRETMTKNVKIPLIVHGDAWPGNFVWTKSLNGEFSVKALLDWQLLHLGNPCEDVVRFLAKGLSGKEYRQRRDFYLRAFYDDLLKDVEPIQLPWPTLEEFIDEYERIYPLIFTVWLPPFLRLVSEEQIKGDGPDALKRLENFNEKFRGMVDEAVRCIQHRYQAMKFD
ncbi:unnamed protein product, partial [Mesorhabditis belari]|uniref:CHK kinase-like domain-containing protein n=1 Tax=Mesorhabditis belari TaxID=2138241 RepID=A0AAF3EEJ4_9BILA